MFALAYAGVEVMSFGIKYLCAVATKSPTNHEKNIANDSNRIEELRRQGHHIPDYLLPHIGPLGWDHINLTGDYIWKALIASKKINLRTLRLAPEYLEAA